jgi:hypothetical protein
MRRKTSPSIPLQSTNYVNKTKIKAYLFSPDVQKIGDFFLDFVTF